MGMPSGFEWLIILGIVLVLFGPTQLPKLAKMIGKSIKSLKDASAGIDSDDEPKQPPAGSPPKNGK